MKIQTIKTLGDLKKAGYATKPIATELADNLKEKLKKGENTFEGIHGYEDTVIPNFERAILSGHHINLLGLRGQAKTRMARLLINLLDEYIPIVEGSEMNDDPFQPISFYARELVKEKGDDTPITWLHRDERFFEKLATPDVSVADLIGDVDPIKASNLKLSYSDERVIHFGMIPRANRSIFVINELPDLQARIQVALFTILQEKEVQIRGFKLRMPLDIQFIFTANPEDYTNRGSIVTPLKDRIGSQILTHYPKELELAKKITAQEARITKNQESIYIPEIIRDIIEMIGFEARDNAYVDAKSGVSARMSISAFENLLSTAERRMLINGEENTSIRLMDLLGIIPAINGKVELIYEGEQEGAEEVARHLIKEAIGSLFNEYFPKIEKLEKPNAKTPYDTVLEWFYEDNQLILSENQNNKDYEKSLDIPVLDDLVKKYVKNIDKKDLNIFKEFLLWGLEFNKKLNFEKAKDGYQFKDTMADYLKGFK
jgi:magnesium chelatase subunit I